MFSFFRSKKHSPDSDNSASDPAPPIPQDDGYIMIEKKNDEEPEKNELYPNIDGETAYMPVIKKQTIHNLQGVPFKISKELLLFETMETYIAQMTEAVTYLTSKLALDDLEYNFNLENSILEVE